jgi:DNA-binding transcriptional ArsR family regulator
MQDTSQNDSVEDGKATVPVPIRDLCRTVRALSHEQRLAILVHLSRKECSVGELERKLDLPQPAVSQQLARLRSDGLVLTRREGRTIYYCAHRQRVGDFLAGLNRLLV